MTHTDKFYREFQTKASNILINVYSDQDKFMRWKSEKLKSAVLTDFGISTSIRVSEFKRPVGTAGWAPPEQWLGHVTEP